MDISILRSLVNDHHGDVSQVDSRIGSIIRRHRPSYTINNPTDDETILENDQRLNDFSEQAIDRMKRLVNNHAASVGRLEVLIDNNWKPIATCFRVCKGESYVATAGHAISWLLKNNLETRHEFDIKGASNFRAARVDFTDRLEVNQAVNNPPTAFDVKRCRYMHSRWDLAVLELDATEDELLERKPLEMELAENWAQFQDPEKKVPVCIIGYPLDPKRETELAEHTTKTVREMLFLGELGGKRMSPGLCQLSFDIPASLRKNFKENSVNFQHDASTLPGSSGSPMFSLLTDKVIGLHYDGRTNTGIPDDFSDPNRCITLPLALRENVLKSLMVESSIVDIQPSLTWSPRSPRVQPINTVGPDNTEESVSPNEKNTTFNGVAPDRPDLRDRIYQSSLLAAKNELTPPKDIKRYIGNQFNEPTCTGFALAAAINLQLSFLERGDPRVSERMLYEMARINDEWVDDNTAGSSLRGVIKGFYHNGVCLADTAPYIPNDSGWTLTRQAAKEARKITLGAYYRLRPNLLDFQLALNETKAVLVSANIHTGWQRPKNRRIGRIQHFPKSIGSHAFVLVGYDEDGFIVQNSWGKDWAAWKDRPGHAHWSYSDWAENLIDAWVLRLSPSVPTAFDIVPKIARASTVQTSSHHTEPPVLLPHLPRPRRFSLIGHVVQIERDRVLNQGRLGMGLGSLRETALYLREEDAKIKYPTIAFCLHDPLLGADTIARLCAYTIEPFKRAGIYPIHIVYGLDEARTISLRIMDEANRIRERFNSTDKSLNSYHLRRTREVLSPLFSMFLQGMQNAAQPGNSLWQAIASIMFEIADEGAEKGCEKYAQYKPDDQPEKRTICLFETGFGHQLANQVQKMELFKSMPVSKRFMVAPCCDQDQLPNIKGEHNRIWQLESERTPSDSLAGFSGDWIDLSYAATFPNSTAIGPFRAPENAKSENQVAAGCHTLHEACSNPRVLKDCLTHFSGKKFSKNKVFN